MSLMNVCLRVICQFQNRKISDQSRSYQILMEIVVNHVKMLATRINNFQPPANCCIMPFTFCYCDKVPSKFLIVCVFVRTCVCVSVSVCMHDMLVCVCVCVCVTCTFI